MNEIIQKHSYKINTKTYSYNYINISVRRAFKLNNFSKMGNPY